MTLEDFETRFRCTLLNFLAETWACRRLPPSEFGQMMDLQLTRIDTLLREMWQAMQPKQEKAAPPQANGQAPQAPRMRATG